MSDMIPLSPIDHIFTGIGSYPIEFIFYYEGNLDEDGLRSSLSESVKHFPAISSRLELISDHSFGLKNSEDGFEFNTADAVDEDFENSDHSKFIDPVETYENRPLAKFKLTRLSKGSVLGVSISHAVTDGFSYFYFLSSWSKIYRQISIIPPDNGRENLIPDVKDVNRVPGYTEVYENCGLFLLDKRNEFSRQNQQWDRIQYSAEKIKSMVPRIQAESPVRLSVNDIVTAMFWKDYGMKWTREKDDPVTYVSCPVDFRRILPGFPGNYFGDGLCLVTTELRRKALFDAEIGELAKMIRSSIAKVGETYIRSTLETLETVRRHKGLDVMESIHVVQPETGLLVTNLSRLPVNELIFNCGPPAASDILSTAQRGAVILPASDGLEIRVCLPQ